MLLKLPRGLQLSKNVCCGGACGRIYKAAYQDSRRGRDSSNSTMGLSLHEPTNQAKVEYRTQSKDGINLGDHRFRENPIHGNLWAAA